MKWYWKILHNMYHMIGTLICYYLPGVDELERLERQVEEDDSRLRKLEEEKNLSAQESTLLKAQQEEIVRQQRMSMDRMKDMERELSAKDDLVSQSLVMELFKSNSRTTWWVRA